MILWHNDVEVHSLTAYYVALYAIDQPIQCRRTVQYSSDRLMCHCVNVKLIQWDRIGQIVRFIESFQTVIGKMLNQPPTSIVFCRHCHTTGHSTTPHPMNRARRWHTVVTLLYDLCLWPCHFGFNLRQKCNANDQFSFF